MEKKKYNMLTYKKKKETIKKKTRELSILCDIKACAIIVGPNGEVDTWPENPSDFNPIIQSYKENLFGGKRKVNVEDEIDDGCFKKKSKKNHALFCDDGDDQWLNNMSRESKESFLVKLNSKLAAVEKRIDFLKTVNNYGNGVVEGSNSSGKEIVLADQETHKSELRGSTVAINVDQLTTSRGKEIVGANQESHNSVFDEFWVSSTVGINGDQLENSTVYNQETELAMAAELWGSAGINGDQLRDCSAYYDQGQEVSFLGVMPDEKNNMWETLYNMGNVQNFGCYDLWPIITGSKFDLLPQEATGFGTLLDQHTLANDSFMALHPNYDYSIPFFH